MTRVFSFLFHRASLLSALLLCGSAFAADDEDEVHFKSKRYVPHSTPAGKAYVAKEYAPRQSARVRDKEFQAPDSSTWRTYGTSVKADTPAFASGAGKAPGEKFVQRETIVKAPTISVAPNQVEEHKPFIKGDIQRIDKKYTAPEKTHEKNPLLAPRQGIKEEHLNEK